MYRRAEFARLGRGGVEKIGPPAVSYRVGDRFESPALVCAGGCAVVDPLRAGRGRLGPGTRRIAPGRELDVIPLPVPGVPDMTDARDERPRGEADREDRFLQLFLANERRIYAFILSLVPSWSDADDLLQETSAVLWRKLDEFEPGSDFVAWALRIARYEVLNYRKRQNRDRGLFSAETEELLAQHAVDMAHVSDDRRDALKACLEKLSVRDRELIRLRYQPGATTRDVSERVGRSLKAVYKALNRIHEQLLLCVRRGLAERGL